MKPKYPLKYFLFVSLVILSGSRLFGQVPNDLPFKVGEELNFKIYFEFILGGDARMAVEGIEKIDGHDCLKIVSEAKSTKTVDRFYKVRDRITTWRDFKGFSRRYEKHLREGKHSDDKIVEYHPEKNLLFLTRKNNGLPEPLELDKPVHDVLAAFYEVRLHELKVDSIITIDLHDIDKRYPLIVKVHRRERIEVPAGTFDCVVIEPMLESAGIFRKKGSLQIWLTDDEFHTPVMMQSQLYFGRVWAKLVDFKRGGE